MGLSLGAGADGGFGSCYVRRRSDAGVALTSLRALWPDSGFAVRIEGIFGKQGSTYKGNCRELGGAGGRLGCVP